MRAWLMLLTLVVGGMGHLVRAQDNLLKNPGFESAPAPSGLPGEGWWLYESRGQPEVLLDRDVKQQGATALRLQAAQDARFVVVSPPFEVSPGDELSFSAQVRVGGSTTAGSRGHFGLAFRDAAGRVFERAYVPVAATESEWRQENGTAVAPANAVRAELHLGYMAAPGALWFDEVQASIISPLSFSLVTGAQPWTGPQVISVRVVNRGKEPFTGTVRAIVARKTTEVPVSVDAGAERVVPVPVTLNTVGSLDYTLELRGAGPAIRTLKGKFRTLAPLVLFPANPCYHVVGGATGATRVDTRIVLDPARRGGLRLGVTLIDSAGQPIAAAEADASTGEVVGVTVPVPTAAPGEFSVAVRLLTRDGQQVARAQTDVRVRPRTESEVTVGADGFLRVAGRAHFPIGMYSCGRYEEMAAAGFSATHHYGITTGEATEAINPNETQLKELLDRSWANGMRMMVELPRKAIEKAQWAQIRRRVETFRHHPGLLCWGSEERVARGEAPLAHVAELHRIVRQLDPGHPLVLGDTREVIGKLQKDRSNFFPEDHMDAGIWWWYPIPLRGPDGNGLEGREGGAGMLRPPSWLTTTRTKKPLWIAIQSYQAPRRDARFPTPAEYRAMAYLSVINGVKALWFYTGSGQRDWQGKPAGLLNRPVEGHWDYVQQLVRELRDLEPVLLAPALSGAVRITSGDTPVEFTVREHAGAIYLLAANPSEQPQHVRFSGGRLEGKTSRVLFEDHAATLTGGEMRDSFAAFGVHVYRFE